MGEEIGSNTVFFSRSGVPTKVPVELTQQEYLSLAETYAQLEWPKQAHECIANIEQISSSNTIAIKARHLADTRLPRQMPTDEAIVLNLRALHARREQQPDLAVHLAKQCVELFPGFEYGYTTLGYLLALEKKHLQASDSFRMALKINPHNIKAWNSLGDELLCIHEYKEATLSFKQTLLYEPGDLVAQNRLDNMHEYEQSNSMIIRCGNVIMASAASFMLPAALVVRDLIALRTSGFVDNKGNFAYHELNPQYVRAYSEAVRFKYGYLVDKRGKRITEKKFRQTADFSNGLAAVCETILWGYIDTAGNYVIAPKFQDAKDFREGLAPAKKSGLWGFCDKTGKWVVVPRFEDAIPFSDGLAGVVSAGKVGYINHQGEFVVPPQFDAGLSFSDGLAIVTNYEIPLRRSHERCIDKSGRVIFDLVKLRKQLAPDQRNPWYGGGGGGLDSIDGDRRYQNSTHPSYSFNDDVRRYSEGLMLFVSDGKYGFVDKSGRVSIPIQFTYAAPFREGLACVSLDPEPVPFTGQKQKPQLFGYINNEGKFVIPPSFDLAGDFHEGLAYASEKDGKSGFIDGSGKFVIRASVSIGSDFHDGLAPVGALVSYP